MKITRCSGTDVHFFDGDKYTVCPVCGKPSIENVEEPQNQDKKNDKEVPHHKGILFGRKNKEKAKPSKGYTITPEEESPTEQGTIAMTEVLSGQVYADTEEDEWKPEPVVEEKTGNSTISRMVPPIPPMPQAPQTNRSPEYDSAKTVGVYADVQTEPVVGWLVCVKGESIGESFNLKAGKNAIGRGGGMDVMLAKERSVSRDKHAVITYEPKKKNFFIQPGESSGLVYLNDELLMSFSQLTAYDSIQLGEAVFKFVPFCGESFIWEDWLEN
ncbi:MAG: FHA domain-containing protein [Butyrivibrio sp.]